MQSIEEVDNALPELILKIEFLTLGYLDPTLDQISGSFVYILQEVLCCSFEKQYLIVVISMVGQVTTFLAYQFTVQTTISHICPSMVWAEIDSIS